ncbi:hypothetical protein QBC44DRAFT_111760 [Cladorrhinum sp. PSN332]|nr:hypothetical protein QBC44DRAFT_111760 [Cladorrhinum sp. PSN332]
MTKARRSQAVNEEGFTLLNSPANPTADVIFVHGLGGHPCKTWTALRPTSPRRPSNSQPSRKGGRFRRSLAKLRVRFFRKRSRRSPSPPNVDGPPTSADAPSINPESRTAEASESTPRSVYWPKDLLVKDNRFAQVRILAYGYDSHITQAYRSTNQNNFFAHARLLFHNLQRETPAGRPLVFVAHSLGGLLVKEVLRRSDASNEPEFKSIVLSTRGVIFLGTPHRGSSEMADLGQIVRNVASSVLRMDTNEPLLRVLGTDSPELELGRDSFTELWERYGFRVKTFQEAYGISGVKVGPLNAKVVPDISSKLDNPKEHAETISANHMDMCKFYSKTDPGFRAISHEIVVMMPSTESAPAPEIDTNGRAFLNSLAFPEMDERRLNIQTALDKTCDWIYSTSQYKDWHNRVNVDRNYGLLWIKGKPGSGKSTLMKHAVCKAEDQHRGAQITVASFFFNARGAANLEKTPPGLYRSILYQVLSQDTRSLCRLSPVFQRKTAPPTAIRWNKPELQDLLRKIFAATDAKPAIIFIDAMDECNDNEVRDLVSFFKNLSRAAWEVGANLRICLSSRHYPQISIDGCPELVVEEHNRDDILRFILSEAEDNRPIEDLKDEILEKSRGVFLWVVLAIATLRNHGRGKSLKWLQRALSRIPPELNKLFHSLFSYQDRTEADRVVCLMQLVLWSIVPLTQHQIHVALAFAPSPSYNSLREWMDSDEYLETPEKIHEMIIDLSKGLLEPASGGSFRVKDRPHFKNWLVAPGPGRSYQFIHETVREFFLSGEGFRLLGSDFASVARSGQLMLSSCFLNYLEAEEFSRKTSEWRAEYNLINSRRGIDQFALNNPGSSLLHYICEHFFHYIERAEESGHSQAIILQRIQGGSNSCELFHRIRTSPFGEHYIYAPDLLLTAIDFALPKTTKTLLMMGFPVNKKTNGARPLNIAAKYCADQQDKRLEIVRLLIEHGADASKLDRSGQSALHIAATSTPAILQAILETGMDVNQKNSNHETAMEIAVKHGRNLLQRVEVLLVHGARIGDPPGSKKKGVLTSLKEEIRVFERHGLGGSENWVLSLKREVVAHMERYQALSTFQV